MLQGIILSCGRFGVVTYVNQYGRLETGSSYNFGPVVGRNVISNATTIFRGRRHNAISTVLSVL